MVAAVCAGIDVSELLNRGAQMRAHCAAALPAELNCGLWLGTAMAHFHSLGRDKVTILTSPDIAAFGLWAEQLIAESTGKEGIGIIPIGQEPIGDITNYSNDRLFVTLSAVDDAKLSSTVSSLREAGHPVISLQLRDAYDLAAEFFRWEFATAVAGAALHIDPFDEPNVQESKDNTKKVLDNYVTSHQLPEETPVETTANVTSYGATLASLLTEVRPGDYVALMAYVPPNVTNEAALQRLRAAIRDEQKVATTLGFGPRFLHSTGQLHKGGPNTGVYIQITADDAFDVEIPGAAYSFGKLKQAQAAGDLQSLRQHGRRVIRLHISGDVPAALESLMPTVRQSAAVTH